MNTDNLNKGIRSWGKATIGDLKAEFARLNIRHVPRSPSPSPAVDALKNGFSQRQGMINKVAFKFPRHMVFVHKGVGGSTWHESKSGTSKRKPKEWFNPVIDKDVEKLADIVADNLADIAVNALSIK